MLEIIERARAAGEPSIVLNTEPDVPWYERHGFRPIPRASWTRALERVAHDQGLDWTKPCVPAGASDLCLASVAT